MKKIISIALIAAAAMLAFSSCSEKQNAEQKDVPYYAIQKGETTSGDINVPDAIKKIFDNYYNEVTSIVNAANVDLKNISVEATASSKFYDTKQLVYNARSKYIEELSKCTDKASKTLNISLKLYCTSDPSKEISYAEFPLTYKNK